MARSTRFLHIGALEPAHRRHEQGRCDRRCDHSRAGQHARLHPRHGRQRPGPDHWGPGVPSGSPRREWEYKRHGTQAVLAAFDVATGRVVSTCGPRRTAADLVDFMDTVAAAYPESPIHVIWDNLNIHYDGREQRWSSFNRRHGGRFHFHYTPKHASWVNQIELFFSILQRKVIRNGNFTSIEDLIAKLLAFISDYDEKAKPFAWTYSADPLKVA